MHQPDGQYQSGKPYYGKRDFESDTTYLVERRIAFENSFEDAAQQQQRENEINEAGTPKNVEIYLVRNEITYKLSHQPEALETQIRPKHRI